MMTLLWNFFAFILALGILVAVHEFGHFWVAKRCGIKVEVFSIGFGKTIWQRKGKDGVLYQLAIIPLGGYVKMLDSRVEEIDENDKPFAFDHQSLWKRSAVVAAGPIFNFLFAILAYWCIYLIGMPSLKPVIGEVSPHSIVASANIKPGLQIQAIDQTRTPDWESVNMALMNHIGDKTMFMTLSLPDDIDTSLIKTLNLESWHFDPDTQSPMQALGFKPYRPEILTKVAQVTKDSPAMKAGVKENDILVRLNQKEIKHWDDFVLEVKAHPNQALPLQVKRDDSLVSLTITPELKTVDDKNIGFVGLAPQMAPWPENYRFEQRYGIFAAIPKAMEKSMQVIGLTFNMVKKLITGDVGIKNLSGPISIAKGAGMSADFGLVYFLSFLALISINLGIMNLLPLPVLDGGHLLFFAIEALIGRPVPEKVQDISYRLGTMAILSLMLIAIFNDFSRL